MDLIRFVLLLAWCALGPQVATAGKADAVSAIPVTATTGGAAADARDAGAASAATPMPADSLYLAGRDLFMQNRMQAAYPLLAEAAKQRPTDPDRQAWLAETLRRLGRRPEAVEVARAATALAPCHSFALAVLADSYNPQYGTWADASAESAWACARRAVGCDSTDGSAWVSAWVLAQQFGDRALERRGLRAFVSSGFLTPPLLAYSRWVLRDLPPNAVLLANGDMDTYPVLALQEAEGLRPDVAIVNLPLLNTRWYIRMVRDRYGLPLPCSDAGVDSLQPFRSGGGEVMLIATQVARSWVDGVKAGTLRRPLTVALTVPEPPADAGRFMFSGPYWLCMPDSAGARVDTALARRCLQTLDPRDFAGDAVGPNDRSPIRRLGTRRLPSNISAAAIRYMDALLYYDRRDDAAAMLPWLERFAPLDPEPGRFRQVVDDYRKKISAKD
ncbi:MAG: tetratricopeptide repeat protein [Candidatus Eisenbacteria bacterium]|nr:tetratricopeptide repeat protein [Candidatus Eisenbacteria bacterium]